jgi:DNA-binding MarR family transcriptional regulator
MARKQTKSRDNPEGTAELEVLMHEMRRFFDDVRAVAQKNGFLQDWGGSAWGLLRVLEDGGPVSMSDLARRRSCSRQNIQKIASEPIAREWIRLEPNPADRRAPLMVITDAGRRKLRSNRGRVESAMRSLSHDVEPEDVARASATVAKVRLLLVNQGLGDELPVLTGPVHRYGPGRGAIEAGH